MSPTEQRLQRRQSSICQLNYWLIVQFQGTIEVCNPQCRLDPLALNGLSTQFIIEEHRSATTVGLSTVHGGVRITNQIARVAPGDPL